MSDLTHRPGAKPEASGVDEAEAAVPESDLEFGGISPAARFARIGAQRAGAAAQIDRTLKAWRKADSPIREAAPAGVVHRTEDENQPKLVSGDQGRIIGWGEGQDDGAVAQTQAVSDGLSQEKLKEMINNGLNKGWVEAQLAQYNSSLAAGGAKLKNKQLQPRKALMEKILSLWP